MHRTAGLLVAFMCVVAVSCVSLERGRVKRQDEPVVIVDAGGNNRHRNSFNPFFYEDIPGRVPSREGPGGPGDFAFGAEFTRRLNTMLSSLQNQFDSLWRRFYEKAGRPMKPTFDDTIGPLPPAYHNTTSVKKVVNGSVITVNETIEKQSDNNSMSFFHVKVIHVRPENPPTTEESDGVTDERRPKPTVMPSRSSTILTKPAAEPEFNPENIPHREEVKPELLPEISPEIEDNMP